MYTTHVFIHLTDKIRNEIDKSNYARGTFVNFKKEFDIVDHHLLLKKKKNIMMLGEFQINGYFLI